MREKVEVIMFLVGVLAITIAVAFTIGLYFSNERAAIAAGLEQVMVVGQEGPVWQYPKEVE